MADWRKNLGGALKKTAQKQFEKESTQMARFVISTAVPAFEELREELERHGREVFIRNAESSVALIVHNRGEEEINYRIQSRMFPSGVVPYADVRYRERRGLKLIRVESMFRPGKQDYTVSDVAREEVIQNFLRHYLPLLARE